MFVYFWFVSFFGCNVKKQCSLFIRADIVNRCVIASGENPYYKINKSEDTMEEIFFIVISYNFPPNMLW